MPKETYLEAELTVILFETEDILSTSGDEEANL